MDTWTQIDNRMAQLKDLYTRMDKTRELVYMDPTYQLMQTVQGVEVPLSGVINVTGNRAAVFGHSVIADLINAKWQMVVEGEISKTGARDVEEFTEAHLAQIDEYLLQRYGMSGLYEWLCNHVCIRGPIGAEFYSWMENGEYRFHCLPLDMRWTAFQYGQDGLEWFAPITFRTKDDLQSEFPDASFSGASDIEVRDYWSGEKNELWIDKKLFKSDKNSFGEPPCVIVFPSAGFMLRDKGYMKHEAEDIFFLMRGLNDEVNRTLSIEQSLIFNVLRPPLEQEREINTAEPAQPAPVAGEVLAVKRGERHIPIPTGDLNRANLSAKTDLQRMIDEGAPIAPRVYTSPPSGAELVAEMEAMARLQKSRIVALQVFKEQFARLMIVQFIKLDAKGLIGKRGQRREWSAGRLKDPDKYSISYQGMTRNKRQELANLAMFAAAYGKLPLRYNLANVLMADDPDGIIEELASEKAIAADPALFLYDKARKLALQAAKTEDEGEADALRIQSKMLTERGVAIIRQRSQPAPTGLPEKAKVPQLEESKGNIQALLPLLGGPAGGGTTMLGAV